MTRVPLDAVPDITNNQVLVITTAPNLGTEDIEKFVTYQVELAVANLPGVTEIRSVSRFGLSVVTIVFKDNAGTYLPRQLVSEALSEAKEKIPKGFGEPFMAPVSSGLGEIYQYTLEVDSAHESLYDDMQLRSMQDWIVKRQMAMLPGVVEVNSFGGRVKQYEVAVNPDKLRSMNITISEIFSALENNNQNTGGAYIEKNHQANFIRGEGLMRSLDDIRNTPVKIIKGNPVFVRDVAEVRYGSFVRYGAFTKDGKGEAVGGIVMMLKGENSNDVIKAVKERVKLIEKSLPEGVRIVPFLDRSKLIKSTTKTVAENLSMGALIVIFILVLFLGNFRGGLIVASTIPLAMLFAFIMMHLFGVWANLMSLGALDFGILIDGSVIIVEAMIYHLHKKSLIGKKLSVEQRDDIAGKSATKMMNSAFFGQLIILIVFIPVLALQGVEGKMFIPMAMTFGFAVVGVMLLSLTYIPMVSATFLQPPKTTRKTLGDRIVISLENIYKPLIDKVINHGRLMVGMALILIIAGAFVFKGMGAEFIPKLDEGDFAFQIFLKPGTSLTEVENASTKVQQLILKNYPNEVESIQARIGVATLPMDPMPLDIADVFVILKPQEEWRNAKSKKELIEKIGEDLEVFTGINFEFTQPIEMRFNELLTGVREDIAIKLYGDDLEVLAAKSQEIVDLISSVDGVAGIKAEATRGLPQITVRYNRNKMGQYGLNIKELNEIIETAFSGGVAGKIYEGERMFDLVIRLDEAHRKSIENLKGLFISLANGSQIPLKEVADISYQPGPMQISRDNTNRSIYVGINVEGRDIKSLVSEIQLKLDRSLELPSGYYIRYGGAFENLERASKRLFLVVPIALFLIFMLVYFAIKSFKQTLMIYVAIPFAAVGGIFSLYLRDMPLSISAGVGFIVLFGVAVLNGLVLINGFNELKEKGKLSLRDIIINGSVRRIRPILLTASTDILGFLPMAISTSAGAEVQRPLATVVIGGMLSATVLTLFVLPVLYKWIESKPTNMKKQKLKPIMVAILVLAAIGFSPILNAQKTFFTLEQALDSAQNNYPAIKAAGLNIEKQNALKSTSYDFGSTSVYTGREEYSPGVYGVQNQIGIEQNDIDLFSIPARVNLSNSRVALANSAKELTEQILEREVTIAWYNVYFIKKQLELFRQMDTLYTDFLKAAELKYKTNESSKIEYLSASAKYMKIKMDIKVSESDYHTALRVLNGFLLYAGEFDIDSKSAQTLSGFSLSDSLNGNVEIDYFVNLQHVAEMEWKVQKLGFAPKLDMAYKKQAIDGVSGFNGWQLGISVPLVFMSQAGFTKASKLDYEIAGKELEQKNIEVKTEYLQLANNYMVVKNLLDYYSSELIPLAEEQIAAAELGYRLGGIDYVQFIQGIESAFAIRMEYVKQQNKLMVLAAGLKYISGK